VPLFQVEHVEIRAERFQELFEENMLEFIEKQSTSEGSGN